MYSIGEFSKINRITTKTLRHYDKIGLLKPCMTDSWTGYRYYSPSQLEDIHRILMLKDMGFSLKEIQEVLCHQETLEAHLQRRVKELEEEVEKSRERLFRVQGYLGQFKRRETMKVEMKSLPEVIVASMRTVVPGYDTYFDIIPKMGEYMNEVGAVCRTPEYCFNIYHDGEYKESDIDVEICEAVVAPCEESDKVKFKTIAEVKEAACLMHKGPYSTLKESYNQLFAWISENGYECSDLPRESYIDGIWNQEDPSQWLTEIQVPVKKGVEK